MTAPVVAMMIMRAAVYRELRARKRGEGVEAEDIDRVSSGK